MEEAVLLFAPTKNLLLVFLSCTLPFSRAPYRRRRRGYLYCDRREGLRQAYVVEGVA